MTKCSGLLWQKYYYTDFFRTELKYSFYIIVLFRTYMFKPTSNSKI